MLTVYHLVIEDATGQVVRRYAGSSRLARPLLGEEVAIDGSFYWVRRVCHREERRSLHQILTIPYVYLAPLRFPTKKIPRIPKGLTKKNGEKEDSAVK